MTGADQPQGEGWWIASDGKWYPPEQAPKPGVPLPPSVPPPENGDRAFFARLFDTTFKTFVTPSIVRILFILGIVVISLYALVILFAGFNTIDDGGIVFVLLAPVFWMIGIIWMRVLIEVVMVLFRIEVNTRRTPPG
jgi:hypothetical protein